MLDNEQSVLASEWDYIEYTLRESVINWDDSTRNQFETQYFGTIAQVIHDYLDVLHDLADTITAVDQFVRYNNL